MDLNKISKGYVPDLSVLPHVERSTKYGDNIGNFKVVDGMHTVEKRRENGNSVILAWHSEKVVKELNL